MVELDFRFYFCKDWATFIEYEYVDCPDYPNYEVDDYGHNLHIGLGLIVISFRVYEER